MLNNISKLLLLGKSWRVFAVLREAVCGNAKNLLEQSVIATAASTARARGSALSAIRIS
jgi:hypothetical protein